MSQSCDAKQTANGVHQPYPKGSTFIEVTIPKARIADHKAQMKALGIHQVAANGNRVMYAIPPGCSLTPQTSRSTKH